MKDSYLFCTHCGELLDFRNISKESIICKSCNLKIDLSCSLNSNSNISLSYTKSEEWKNKLFNKIDQIKSKKEHRKIMEQDCPKNCGGREIATYEMQLRSADEGSTVFCECLKCGFGFIENN